MKKKEIEKIIKNTKEYLYEWYKKISGYDYGYNLRIKGELWIERSIDLCGYIQIDPFSNWYELTYQKINILKDKLRNKLGMLLKPILEDGFKVIIKTKINENGCEKHIFNVLLY